MLQKRKKEKNKKKKKEKKQEKEKKRKRKKKRKKKKRRKYATPTITSSIKNSKKSCNSNNSKSPLQHQQTATLRNNSSASDDTCIFFLSPLYALHTSCVSVRKWYIYNALFPSITYILCVYTSGIYNALFSSHFIHSVCVHKWYLQCFIFLSFHTLCVCTLVVFTMLYFPLINTLCVCKQVVFIMLYFPFITYTLCVYTSGIYNALFSSHYSQLCLTFTGRRSLYRGGESSKH